MLFLSRGSWVFGWFLRMQYAVGFTQYALGGVFECCDLLVHRFTRSQNFSRELCGSNSNGHQLSTINHQLKSIRLLSIILNLGSWFFFQHKVHKGLCFHDWVLWHYRDPSFVGMPIVSKRIAVIQNTDWRSANEVLKRSEESSHWKIPPSSGWQSLDKNQLVHKFTGSQNFSRRSWGFRRFIFSLFSKIHRTFYIVHPKYLI